MPMFKKLFHRKPKPNSRAYRREMAQQIANHHIRYVTENRDGVDEVIGREGSVAVRDGQLLVHTSSGIIFRCEVDSLDAWELLSKDGVVLTAPDLTQDGQVRTIIVYYVYYR